MAENGPALALEIRRHVVEQSKRAGVGHIGSALSIADIMAALFGGVLRIEDGPDRDRFVLSKGHAVLALYAALHATGRMSHEELSTYCADGTALGGHPEHVVPGIDFSTGSLGHGLSIGAGAALAARIQESPRRSVVLVSDAELNEGSVWEAAMFAAHRRLSNLVAIVDVNGQQAFGYTADVLDLSPHEERWRAFGWDAVKIDGHDPERVAAEIGSLDVHQGPPHVLLAETTFGKGVPFMEGKIEWHYWPLSDDQYREAIRGLEAAGAAGAKR